MEFLWLLIPGLLVLGVMLSTPGGRTVLEIFRASVPGGVGLAVVIIIILAAVTGLWMLLLAALVIIVLGAFMGGISG